MTRSSPSLKPDREQRGFSLAELAIVLVIVGLLVGGMLMPLSAQQESVNVKETERRLSEIRDALLGFAATNGRLPCPDTDNDPAAAGYGQEEASCAASLAAEGYLPWKTLGVSPTDAWGSLRTSSSDPRTGDWRYRVDRNFAQAFLLTTGFSADSLSVRNNAGNTLSASSERPIAIVFSAGPDGMPNGDNASFEPTSGIYQAGERSTTFDDQTIWLSRPLLNNRMIAAGKLP